VQRGQRSAVRLRCRASGGLRPAMETSLHRMNQTKRDDPGTGTVPPTMSDCRAAVPDHPEAPVKLSARNKLDGTVTSIHKGEAIANVALDVGGQRLVASITVEAVQELGLREGTAVTAIVKASDVILGIDG
jgi:molybdopterin-binding protein